MSSIKSRLLEQFSRYDHHIHRLWGTDDGIEDKSHEYFELQSKVSNLDRTAEPGKLESLKSRSKALQGELVFRVGDNQR